MLGRCAVVMTALAVAAGCYDPAPAAGVMCSETGQCPTGQECDRSRDVCVVTGSPVDAPFAVDAMIDAQIDAPIDAAAIAPQLRSYSTADNGDMTMTVPSPPGVAVGDLLLAHVSSDAAGTGDIPTPSGWTRVIGQNGDNAHCTLAYYRWATDPTASYTFTFINTYGAIRLMAFTGVHPTDPIDVFTSSNKPESTTPTAASVTTTTADTLLVTLFVTDVSSVAMDLVPNMTTVYTDFTGQLAVLAAIEPRPMAGATGIRQTSTTDAGPSSTITLALAPP